MSGQEAGSPVRTSPSKKPVRRKVFRFLRHPFFILLIGAGLTSYILPQVIARSDRDRLKREEKHRMAIDIISRSTDFDSHLNSLRTSLLLFHEDNLVTKMFSESPERYRDAQGDLNRRMRDLYLELDKTAWWWYSETPREAAIRQIASPEMVQGLLQDFGDYSKNVGESTGVAKNFWHQVVSPGYDPKDKTALNENEKTTTEKFEERKAIVNRIVQRFISE